MDFGVLSTSSKGIQMDLFQLKWLLKTFCKNLKDKFTVGQVVKLKQLRQIKKNKELNYLLKMKLKRKENQELLF